VDWERFWAGLFYFLYALVSGVAGMVAGIVAGAGQAVGCYLVPMYRVATARLDGLELPIRTLALPAERDPAVRDYLHGPARVDLAHVRQLAISRAHLGFATWSDRIETWCNPNDDPDAPVVSPGSVRDARERARAARPPAIGMAIGLVLGALAGAIVVALLAAVHEIVVGVLAVGWRILGLALRLVDSALLRVRNIRMRCTACFERMPYPAYRCPDCDETHWEIRPGADGILRRTCACGRQLPTLLMTGTGALAARCPYRGCGSELEYRPGTVAEQALPVFGATGAGKTRLMYALVLALQQLSDRSGVTLEFADTWTEQQLATARHYMDGTLSVVGTPPALQRGLVLNLRVGRRTRLLQFFDAAGERFYTQDRSSDLLYLGSGRTFVLVVDPLAVDGFWTGLPADDDDRLRSHKPVNVPQPDMVYQQTVERVVELRGAPARSRLALVFSRADMLGAAGGGDLERWVTGSLGLGGLLRSARMDFKEVTLFRTAAVLSGDTVDGSVTALLSWMLISRPEPALVASETAV